MPATTYAASEAISSYLKSLQLNELRHEGAVDIDVPGLNTIPKTPHGSYPFKNVSDQFKMDGRKGKTQQIPTVNGLTANTRITSGVDSAYQPITRSYRNITINTPIEVAVKFSKFDKDFWQLPINEQAGLKARIDRAINENIQTNAFALQSSATASAIGGATTLPTLDFIRKVKDVAELTYKNPVNDPGYLFLNSPQANYMAAVHGFDAAPSAYGKPHNDLGQRGVDEYESGLVMKPVLGTKILVSNLVADGSVSTSTYNLYIKGKEKLGVAFGYVSGFEMWDEKNTSETRVRFELEYGLFILDTRCVFRTELIKSPG